MVRFAKKPAVGGAEPTAGSSPWTWTRWTTLATIGP